MTSRRSQRDEKPDKFDAAALEAELRAARPEPNRKDRRRAKVDAAVSEAAGYARVTGQHYQSRPTA